MIGAIHTILAGTLGDLVEFVSVLCHACHSGHRILIQDQNHESRIRHASPLAHKTVLRGRLEPKARVVLGMPDDDNERTAANPEHIESTRHQLRANTLSLVTRQYGHRPQPHPDNALRDALDHDRRKEDVANHTVTFRHQRQRVSAGLPQGLDEIGLSRLPEREFVEVSHPAGVFRSF